MTKSAQIALSIKTPESRNVQKRDKIFRLMELRGIADWIEGKLEILYKPVASVPHAPNFIELMGLDIHKDELLEILTNLCASHWDNESELDEALAFLETGAGKKLVDRGGALSHKLSSAFDDYLKTKLDEKAQAFKRSTMQ